MASWLATTFRRSVLRWVARLLIVLWALYWIYFMFTSGTGVVSLIYMILVLAIVGLTWRQELTGGVLLILQVVFAWSTLGEASFQATTFNMLMVWPPLLVGVLLILNWWLARLPVVEKRPAQREEK